MVSNNYRLSSNQLIAIILNVIGVILVFFGYGLLTERYAQVVENYGTAHYEWIIPNAEEGRVMLLIAVAVLVVALIMMVRSMRNTSPTEKPK
jgi:hypothetical protein